MAELPIALTMGDPAGVGPEITVLALAGGALSFPVRVIGDRGRLKAALEVLSGNGRIDGFDLDSIDLIDLANVSSGLAWGRLAAEAGRACFEYVEAAAKLTLAGKAAAVCTAPINKEAWRAAGVPHPGHTEALAALCGTERFAMMLVNQRLRVVHLSTHSSLLEAIALATSERCVECLQLAAGFLRDQAGIPNPRLAVAGINPHAGENGLLGKEDRDRLLPAVTTARAGGIDASGPWSPDTVFARAAAGEFDCVIAAYHDQGHIPIKMLGLDSGVNVTIGLPIIRTSVDHGTAFDIAGKGLVRSENLVTALNLAHDLALVRS